MKSICDVCKHISVEKRCNNFRTEKSTTKTSQQEKEENTKSEEEIADDQVENPQQKRNYNWDTF